jgi:hypothetical protein
MMVRQKEPQLDIEGAERLAIEGLAFLASEPEELGRFLALVGLGPETLRDAANDPGFLTAVLEYFLENEALLLVFAARANIRPTLIAAARYLLDRDFHE